MLSILGFIALIIIAVFAYRTARENNRRPFLWALIVFGVGFAIQIVVPFLFGVGIAIYMTLGGSTVPEIQEAIHLPAMIIGVICLILSVAAAIFILLRIQTAPAGGDDLPPPPPAATGLNLDL